RTSYVSLFRHRQVEITSARPARCRCNERLKPAYGVRIVPLGGADGACAFKARWVDKRAKPKAQGAEGGKERVIGIEIDAEVRCTMRLQKCRRVFRRFLAFTDRNDGEAGQSAVKMRNRGQFLHAGRTPCGPQVEQHVMAVKCCQRQALALRI